MALAYSGIECELRELVLRDKPADMLKHSPKGTVPVLITTSGEVLDESSAIMLWALEQHDPDDWLQNQAASMQLIKHNDHSFKPLLDRYKYADRYPELSAAEHRELTLPHLEMLNQRLHKSAFLLGDTIRLADTALFPFIRQYAFVDKPWFDELPFTELQQWLNGLLDAALFQTVMPKFKLFNDGYSHHFPSGQQKTT